jgi:predicted secreted Zn-dependent protease
VIPALNINNDPHLDKVRTDLVDAVGNKSAKELREDDGDRKEVAAKARAVADNISNLFD